MEVIDGRLQAPASPSSTQDGPCVDIEAREALQALLGRIQELEKEASHLHSVAGKMQTILHVRDTEEPKASGSFAAGFSKP